MASQNSSNILQKSVHRLSLPACSWTFVGGQSPVVGLVCSRSYWGNRNLPKPRGKHRPNKHKLKDFSKYRAAKVMKIELPDYDVQRKIANDDVSPDEMRAFMKKQGMMHPVPSVAEAPLYIGATGAVIEPFTPPETDSYADLITKEGAMKQGSAIKSKTKTFRATRKVRGYDDEFDPKKFATTTALDIYIKAHQALAAKREKDLLEFVTEKVYPEMLAGVQRKSMYWEFVKSLEPPRVVQVRCEDFLAEGNSFGQVTVRFNSQQILAVYDRFGRLIHGHPHVAKDVLEYVVFESHLANIYGKWRLHAKIIPDWLAAQRPSSRITQVISPEDLEDEEEEEEEEQAAAAAGGEDWKHQEAKPEEDENKVQILDKFGRSIGQYEKKAKN